MTRISLPTLTDVPTLWSIYNYGQQTVPAGGHYWWDNRYRPEPDAVVFQAIDAGSMIFRDMTGEPHHDTHVGTGMGVLFTMNEPTAYGHPTPSDQPLINRWLNLQGAGLREHWLHYRQLYGSVVPLPDGSRILQLFNDLLELASPAGDRSQLVIASRIHQFIMALHELAEQQRSITLTPVQRAVDAIVNDPTRDWSLQQVADTFEISREHLSRVFLETMQETPAAYIQRHRLNRALALLRDTDLPLREITAQCVLGTPRTLTRLVKLETTLTPGKYRAQHRSQLTHPKQA